MSDQPYETASVEQLTSGWPKTPSETAKAVIGRYGPPQEASPNMLVWHQTGPWKKMILSRDEAQHLFPKPHMDVLEQVVNYHVPADRVADLIRFDGSVMYERTRGELSARCENEQANFLALNLAHDIATGRSDVDAARRRYTAAMQGMAKGELDPYLTQLTFDPSAANTADPDEMTLGETMMHRLGQAFGVTNRSK